ncbi:TetR family transcriptional regulator [Nocardioides bizhenqiangii]|uniref:TetR family transcriptional regulator n=1 Tax=Nocardioides bizhenqiangii TaxID=3095076 RepID=A0ABZ0ZNM5_9ACTN|nr:TetR family transcriptional regulator [Nocardioides sp. HM61]WQQ25217.1 TetR family transcriptional regulator [Nocardioides sp. HM61]
MTETRVERKERTRRAILDAALELCETQPLAALSLRQVAKEVGIVPTAFYRHFDSIDHLGLELVDESFSSLRALLKDARTFDAPPATDRALFLAIVDNSVDALVTHVPNAERHYRFIARERLAGPKPVREAVRHQLELIERELATDIAQVPGAGRWSGEDLRILANLLVNAMLFHAEELALAGGRPDVVRRTQTTARRQLRIVLIGALSWDSSR